MDYTIKQIKEDDIKLDTSMVAFFIEVAKKVADMYGNKYDWRNFPIYDYANNHRVVICKRDEELVGVMLSRLGFSIFDPSVKNLRQDLLYARPGTRAAHYLIQEFIDFGERNANHIITTINQKTNIKGSTLEKAGFEKLEVLYRMEV